MAQHYSKLHLLLKACRFSPALPVPVCKRAFNAICSQRGQSGRRVNNQSSPAAVTHVTMSFLYSSSPAQTQKYSFHDAPSSCTWPGSLKPCRGATGLPVTPTTISSLHTHPLLAEPTPAVPRAAATPPLRRCHQAAHDHTTLSTLRESIRS